MLRTIKFHLNGVLHFFWFPPKSVNSKKLGTDWLESNNEPKFPRPSILYALINHLAPYFSLYEQENTSF